MSKRYPKKNAPHQPAPGFTDTPQSSRHLKWFWGLFLVIATVIAYQPAWHAGFIWDDDAYIVNNPLLSAPDGLERIWFSPKDTPSQYFPLTYTAFRIEHSLWGLNPASYHWVNILLHAVNALILWQLLKRLRVPGAWLAAAIFALHPVQVEAVAWISEQKSVLSLFFFLLALHAWVEFVEERPKRLWRWYWLTLACFALALFAKTTACTLPAALILILWLKKRPIGWPRMAQMIPFLAVGTGMGLLTMLWERLHQGPEGRLLSLGLVERILVASHAVWFYAGKLFWPTNLTFSYPLWKINPSDPLAYGWLAAAAGLCAAIYFGRRFVGRSVEVGVTFFVATLSPLLGFIMLYTFHYSYVADHYQYVACIGLIALTAAGIAKAFEKKIFLKPMFCGALLLTLGLLTWQQCKMYANLDILWRTTISRNPNSVLAHNDLGVMFLNRGQLDDAIAQFQKVLEIEPDNPDALDNLGNALVKKGQLDEAIARYQEALTSAPYRSDVEYNLANAFAKKGRLDEALTHFQRAWKIRPDYVEAYNNAGNVLLRMGRVNDALSCWQRDLEIQPNLALPHNNIGRVLLQYGRLDEAIGHFQKALEIQPNFADARNYLAAALLQKGQTGEAIFQWQKVLESQPQNIGDLNNLAWVLATCPDGSLRNGREAVELARRANQLSAGENLTILQTLAAAYAEVGQFPSAVATLQRTLQIAAAQKNTSLTSNLQTQLKLYQAGTPFRDNSLTHDR